MKSDLSVIEGTSHAANTLQKQHKKMKLQGFLLSVQRMMIKLKVQIQSELIDSGRHLLVLLIQTKKQLQNIVYCIFFRTKMCCLCQTTVLNVTSKINLSASVIKSEFTCKHKLRSSATQVTGMHEHQCIRPNQGEILTSTEGCNTLCWHSKKVLSIPCTLYLQPVQN